MREHAGLTDEELGGARARRRGSDRRGRRRAPRRARGPIPDTLEMASTPARGAQRHSCAPSRATAPGSTTSCAARARVVLHGVFRMTRRGASRTCRARAASCSRRCTARTSTRSRSASRSTRGASAPMAKYELFLVPVLGRAIALGGGSRCARGVQDREAYETAMRLLRDGEHAARVPRGHAQPRRQGAAAAGRRAARARGGRGARAGRRSRGTDPSGLCRRGCPKFRVYYGPPIALDDLPADDLRRASHTATKRWTAAIEAGLASSGRARRRQAARWSIRRWRCSCSQAWCQERTRAA